MHRMSEMRRATELCGSECGFSSLTFLRVISERQALGRISAELSGREVTGNSDIFSFVLRIEIPPCSYFRLSFSTCKRIWCSYQCHVSG